MRYSAAITSLALAYVTGTAALALPQDIDFDYVDSMPDLPTATIEIGAAAQTIIYDKASALAEVSSAVLADGAAPTGSLEKRANCDPQPAGTGPTVNSPDDAATFLAYADFKTASLNAPTPNGYTSSFKNAQASNNAFSYMGYRTLPTYDTNLCAQKCNEIVGCNAFNICK